MKTTTELLQQLNTMQTEHIKVLEERIKVINEHRQHLNETISNQAHQLESQYKRIEFINKTNNDLIVHLEVIREQKKIDDDTIGKLFATAKKDKEVIKQFKQLINQQGKQIIDLQKENDSLFAESCINKTTLELQKEVKQLSKQ
tara:strand:- start:84 stop:515 length:432 start_codon:yes stop_codon:yes gene_type:complete